MTVIPINRAFVGPFQQATLPTDSGGIFIDNRSAHRIEVVAWRMPTSELELRERAELERLKAIYEPWP